MMTVPAPIPAEAVIGVTSLLGFLADKDGCAKRLAALKEAEVSALEHTKSANELAAKVSVAGAEHLKVVQAHEAAVAAHKQRVADFEADKAAVEADLNKQAANLRASSVAYNARETALKTREDAVVQREAKVAADAAATVAALKDAEVKQADLAKRIALIQQAQR